MSWYESLKKYFWRDKEQEAPEEQESRERRDEIRKSIAGLRKILAVPIPVKLNDSYLFPQQ